MATKKSETNPGDDPGQDARLSPKLSAYVNIILTRRFVEAQSFPKLIKSLAQDGIATSGGRLKEFVRRVLCVVGPAQAARIGANQGLLVVVRRRLGLPLEPRGRKIAAVRSRKRFDPRNRRRRRIRIGPNPGRPAAPSPRHRDPVSSLKDQPVSTGIVPEALPAEVFAFEKLGRLELAALNQEAIRKIRLISRHVVTNVRGTCLNIRTREDYGAEDLQQEFGLTYAEARSCYLTFDPAPVSKTGGVRG